MIPLYYESINVLFILYDFEQSSQTTEFLFGFFALRSYVAPLKNFVWVPAQVLKQQ